MKPIYLDYNATTPIDPRVAEKMLPFINEHFGNPSSSHIFGTNAKKAVDHARNQVAEMLHARFEEVIFTSGGSESNNYAIKGAALAYRHKGNHIITTAIEHPAVIQVCRYLETQGFQVTYLPVDHNGLVDPADVKNAMTPQTILISVMHANNEVGTIQPVREIADIAHEHGIIVHSDCAQSVGKIPARVDELNVDLLSIAGHKLYAPKGIGVLYIRTGVKLEKLIHGADHEMNLRGGTENVIEIAGLGEACELITENLDKYREHMLKTRNELENSLKERFPFIQINGHPEKRLPNTSSVSFKGIEANLILSGLKNVAASAGAACHSDKIDVSAVLEAMKVPLEYAMGTIRFSVGRFTTIQDIRAAAQEISEVVGQMRPLEEKPFLDIGQGEVKLTQFTHGLGCACKIRPQLLEAVLRKLPVPTDKNVLVGTESSDDAAVYRIDDKTAIVQTVDFFTPVVDNPFDFGAIAAANSLSDIYAMGGKALFALNIVGFPANRLPLSVLEDILRGAQSKAEEAGISIIGGHTVEDTEPKFGLSVTGIADPKKIVTNSGAAAGDLLILTKPIGTGILSTALKQGMLEKERETLLIKTMAKLNKNAAEAMRETGVNACTDITGFGLIGHLLEMMKGSGTSAMISAGSIPLLPGVTELAASGVVPGGTRDNFSYTESYVQYDEQISSVMRLVLNDAQTSGGLLIAVPESRSERLMKNLKKAGENDAVLIGRVINENAKKIKVINKDI
ncbi:MAG: selenide, water dikinase SelD [Calditrichaceae bacterium]